MTDSKSFTDLFSLLPSSENPKQTSFDGVPYILHEDHRWLLPIAFVAQERCLLPKPCTVVMFDQHHDALDPLSTASNELKRLRAEPSMQGIVSLCADHLKKNDDDWLKAGMDLGIFGDVMIFGVHNYKSEADHFRIYTDNLGCQHRIEMTALPKSAIYESHLNASMPREILGWKVSQSGFQFLPGQPKILLTIDLDCFAIHWGEYIFAWPTKIFHHEFLEPTKFDWTGRLFLQGLAKKAGIVTFAREPGCCGGEDDAETILKNLIHYGFDDKFSFE